MKLPRPLLWTMLFSSVASVLVAAGWWWITWPERKAARFVERMSAELIPPEIIESATVTRRGPIDRLTGRADVVMRKRREESVVETTVFELRGSSIRPVKYAMCVGEFVGTWTEFAPSQWTDLK